jgi:AbrB family looped-hinge helix DNA binding protein
MVISMSIDTIKMSSKGQVVIPSGIRQELDAGEGTLFAVIGTKDAIILKKISTPSKEQLMNDLKDIAIEGKRKLAAKGISEEQLKNWGKK